MKILKEVLSLLTAPFHEGEVIEYIEKFCATEGFRLRRDRYNNLFIRYKRGKARQPVILTAHMDHPGFEIIQAGANSRALAGILGGINIDKCKGAGVAVMTKTGIVRGRVAKKDPRRKWMKKPVFEIEFKKRDLQKIRRGDYGWYDLPAFELKGDLVHTKGADNLAGVAVLLELLTLLKRSGKKADVTALFTRAEEVGFIGCSAVARSGRFSASIPVIVIECSSAASGGIKIGEGPVVRVGDKLTCYSTAIDRWLSQIAAREALKDKKFKFQRALLAGGTCEASVWALKGASTGGIAVPLGNYHNNGKRGVAPEFISRRDYKALLKFLNAVVLSGRFAGSLDTSKTVLAKIYKLWERKLKLSSPR